MLYGLVLVFIHVSQALVQPVDTQYDEQKYTHRSNMSTLTITGMPLKMGKYLLTGADPASPLTFGKTLEYNHYSGLFESLLEICAGLVGGRRDKLIVKKFVYFVLGFGPGSTNHWIIDKMLQGVIFALTFFLHGQAFSLSNAGRQTVGFFINKLGFQPVTNATLPWILQPSPTHHASQNAFTLALGNRHLMVKYGHGKHLRVAKTGAPDAFVAHAVAVDTHDVYLQSLRAPFMWLYMVPNTTKVVLSATDKSIFCFTEVGPVIYLDSRPPPSY